MESTFQPPVSPKHEKTNIWYLVLAVVVLIGLLFLFGAFGQREGVQNQQFTKENVEVTETDLSEAQGEDRIPSGFPSGLFVETESITESYVLDYKDRGVVQHSIAFDSKRNATELFQEYETYLRGEGYQVVITSASPKINGLVGSKDNDDISVVVSEVETGSTVQISFLDRN